MSKSEKGFTLLEVLLVVAIIAILAGIVILAINPNKQLAESRDAQRRSDVNAILNAVYQYTIDEDGTVPASITTTATQICKTTPTNDCTGLIDLSVVDADYLIRMPIDPKVDTTVVTDADDSTGYLISKDTNGRITVSTTSHEQATSAIEVIR